MILLGLLEENLALVGFIIKEGAQFAGEGGMCGKGYDILRLKLYDCLTAGRIQTKGSCQLSNFGRET